MYVNVGQGYKPRKTRMFIERPYQNRYSLTVNILKAIRLIITQEYISLHVLI